MLRISLIAVAFLGVTVVLILMQPSTPSYEVSRYAVQVQEPTEVTRAQTNLAQLTTAVDNLEKAEVEVDTGPSDLQTATFSVQGNLADVAVAAKPAPVTGVSNDAKPEFETLIIQALQQGQSESYIDALVNDAAATGKIEVPASLITSDGRIDTKSLLTALSGGAGQVYEVRHGDTLSSISYRFYGRTGEHDAIYEANQDTMTGPGQITVGMKLNIPAL